MIYFVCNSNIVFKYHLSFPFVCSMMPMNVLKFLQDYPKLAFFPLFFNTSSGQHLLLTKFFIFLKSTCLLHVIFLKFFLNQIEKHGFIWSKNFDFLFQKRSIFYSVKKKCSLKIAIPEFYIP